MEKMEEPGVVNPDAGFALIVNYLPPSFSDHDLHHLFSDVGPLYSAKIMRNKHTNSSFGYGFVNFVKKEDAERAIEKKDGEKVLHKQIRVAFSRRGEGPDAIKNANLFVGNLPLAWKEGDLERAFKQHGSVIKCKVLIDQLTGVSRGCGFVLFSKTAEADNAIKEIDGKKLAGCEKALLVKRNNLQEEAAKSKFTASSASNSSGAKEVHVIHHYASYPMDYTGVQHPYPAGPGDKLAPPHHQHHHHHPHHPHHQTPYDKWNSPFGSAAAAAAGGGVDKSPLYAFYEYPVGSGGGGVPYASMPQIPSMTLPVGGMGAAAYQPSTPQRSSSGPSSQPQSTQGVSLFVYNVGPECTELDLYQLFGPYGAISKAHIQRDLGTGKSKGFGFVTYNEREEAMRAIANLHGYAWEKNDFRLLQVSFKKEK